MSTAAVAPRPRVLFVDDEPAVLEAIAANLRRELDVVTSPSGAAGLQRLQDDATIRVVVSDMRMPQMDGATFLARARELAPATVRILLTGQADMASAIDAINNGQIFRFLTKPCPRDQLRATVEQAVEQHRLQQIERDMLEQTVRGSVKMLCDVLALSSPAAFGRGNRIKTRVLELAAAMGVKETWHLEVAALSSQLGYVSLSDELVAKLQRGDALNDDERTQVERVPETAIKLLGNIPRLGPVCEVLAAHGKPPRRFASSWRSSAEIGAHLLRFAIDLDELEGATGQPLDVATVRVRLPNADAEVLAAYEKLRTAAAQGVPVKEIAVPALRVGMTLAEDVRLANGTLLVARGYEVTAHLIDRLQGFPAGAVRATVKVVSA